MDTVNETIYNEEGFKGGERSRGVGKLNQFDDVNETSKKEKLKPLATVFASLNTTKTDMTVYSTLNVYVLKSSTLPSINVVSFYTKIELDLNLIVFLSNFVKFKENHVIISFSTDRLSNAICRSRHGHIYNADTAT